MTDARADGYMRVLIDERTAELGLDKLEGAVQRSMLQIGQGSEGLGKFQGNIEKVATATSGLASVAGGAGSQFGALFGAVSNLAAATLTGGPLLGGIALVTTGLAYWASTTDDTEEASEDLADTLDTVAIEAIERYRKKVTEAREAVETWEESFRKLGRTTADHAIFEAQLRTLDIEAKQLAEGTELMKEQAGQRRLDNEARNAEAKARVSNREIYAIEAKAAREAAETNRESVKNRITMVATLEREKTVLNNETIPAIMRYRDEKAKTDKENQKGSKKTTEALSAEAVEAARIAKNIGLVHQEQLDKEERRLTLGEAMDKSRKAREKEEREEAQHHRLKLIQEAARADEEAAKAQEKREREARQREKRMLRERQQEWSSFTQTVGDQYATMLDTGLDLLEAFVAGEEIRLAQIAASFLRSEGTKIVGIGIRTIAEGVGLAAAGNYPQAAVAAASGAGLIALGTSMGGAGAVLGGLDKGGSLDAFVIPARDQDSQGVGGIGGSVGNSAGPSGAGSFNSGPRTDQGPIIYNVTFSSSTIVGNPNESVSHVGLLAHQAEYEQFAQAGA